MLVTQCSHERHIVNQHLGSWVWVINTTSISLEWVTTCIAQECSSYFRSNLTIGAIWLLLQFGYCDLAIATVLITENEVQVLIVLVAAAVPTNPLTIAFQIVSTVMS